MLSGQRFGSIVLRERGGSITGSIYKVNIAGYSHYGPNLISHGGIVADIIKVHSGERKCLPTIVVSHPNGKG